MRKLSVRIAFWISLAVSVLLWVLGHTFAPALEGVGAGFLAPFMRGASFVQQRVTAVVSSLAPGNRDQVRELQKHARELELELAHGRVAARENAELRALLGLPEHRMAETVMTRVINRDPVTWNRRFRIGSGAQDGIRVGAAVLAGGAVIGRVTKCHRTTAVVTTIADPGCRLSVRVADTDGVGILSGRLSQGWREEPVCLVDFLPRDLIYEEDSLILTSGLGEQIPGGLPVGHVVAGDHGRLKTIIDGAYAQIHLRPIIDLAYISHVAVVCPRKSGSASSVTSGRPN